MYPPNMTLILIEELMPIDERVYFDKIDLLYDGLIFMYGIEDLTSMNNSEKFKKEIQVKAVYYLVIDSRFNFSLNRFVIKCWTLF